jgi:hypothetical protein
VVSPTPPKRLRSSLCANFGTVPSRAPDGRGAATDEESLAAEALISLCTDSSGDAGPCPEPVAEAASVLDAAAGFGGNRAAEARDALTAGGGKPLQVGLPCCGKARREQPECSWTGG